MFNKGQKVKCKETGMIGFIDDKEWENGWIYTIETVNHTFFYRDETELVAI